MWIGRICLVIISQQQAMYLVEHFSGRPLRDVVMLKRFFSLLQYYPPPPTERLHASMKHQQRSAIYFQAQQETAASKPREEKKIKHKQLLFAYSDLRFGRSRSSKVNLLSSGFLSTIKTGFNSTFSECRCKDAEHFRLCESLRAPSAV